MDVVDHNSILGLVIGLIVLVIIGIYLHWDMRTITCPNCKEIIVGEVLEDGDIGESDRVSFTCACGFRTDEEIKYKGN